MEESGQEKTATSPNFWEGKDCLKTRQGEADRAQSDTVVRDSFRGKFAAPACPKGPDGKIATREGSTVEIKVLGSRGFLKTGEV